MEARLLADGLGWGGGAGVAWRRRVCFVETFRTQVSVWPRTVRSRGTPTPPNICRRRWDLVARTANGRRGGRRRCRCRRSNGSTERTCADHRHRDRRDRPQRAQRPRLRTGSTSPTRARIDRTPSHRGSSSSTSQVPRALPPRRARSHRPPNGIAIEADGSVVWAESYTWSGAANDMLPHRRHRCCPATTPSPTCCRRRWPAVRHHGQRWRHRCAHAERPVHRGRDDPDQLRVRWHPPVDDRRRRHRPHRRLAARRAAEIETGSEGGSTWIGRIG